jgi:hypothetical protein
MTNTYKMSESSSNTSTPKAKKARKPFVWTPERKATFEKMRLKRAEALAEKKKLKEDNKLEVHNERKSLDRLLRIKEEMKKLLSTLEKPKEPEEEVQKITPKPDPPKIEKQKPLPKPIPQPEPEPEEEEEQEEEEQQVYIPPPPPKPKKELYRYTTKNQHYSLPKPPLTSQPFKVVPQAPQKPQFTYL